MRLPAALALFVAVLALPLAASALPQNCLPAPFPTTTQPPVFTLDLTESFGDDHAGLELWRVPCTDGSGQTAALVRITPITVNPLMCSFDLKLIQGGQQFRAWLRKTPGNLELCDKLFIPVTYEVIEESDAPITFNAARAFILISDGKTVQQVSVPAISAAFVPPSVTIVASGCTTCHSGQVVGYTMNITNPGQPTSAELKGGVRLPDGTILPFVNLVTTLPSGSSVLPLIPTQALPGGLPAVDVLVEAAILDPSLGVSLSRHNVTLHLLP